MHMKKFTNLDTKHPHTNNNSLEASHNTECLYDEDLSIQMCDHESCGDALNETANHNHV